MNTYREALKTALQEQGFSVGEVAKQVNLKQAHLQKILNGERQATLSELVAICSFVSLDINQLLGIKEVDNTYMLLDDPLQLKLNSITRNIGVNNEKDFVKAVEYLAECFIIKEKREK